MLETLEGRAMLSASATVHGDVLRVRGHEHAPNTIVVGNSADGTKIDVSISFVKKNGVAKTITASFPTTLEIEKLRIRGGKQADNISINQTTSPFTIKTLVEAHGGNDVILMGDEVDIVDGGRGDDSINVGLGNDIVLGRRGNDVIVGGEGNDTLWGGLGNDNIDAGNGDDVLGGILGVNTLMGGAGKDTFWVRSLEKNPVNDFNATDDTVKSPKKHGKGANKGNDEPETPQV
jgi:Ca2+-binding RTX toxin-like protein